MKKIYEFINQNEDNNEILDLLDGYIFYEEYGNPVNQGWMFVEDVLIPSIMESLNGKMDIHEFMELGRKLVSDLNRIKSPIDTYDKSILVDLIKQYNTI